MKLSDWLPSVFVEGDGDDIQVTTKKFSQFPTATGEGIQGVGIKDGNNVKFELTTDSIKVNPEPFRNEKGQFIGTPEELADIENQRDVNNFLYQAINDIEAGDIDLDGYATTDQLTEVDRTSQMRDEALDSKIDQESNLNTVAHLKLEDQILRCYAWSEGDNESLERKLTKVDEGLQSQIDENKDSSESGDRQLQAEIDQIGLALETLLVQREHGQWKYVGFSGDTIPRNAGEFALISDDLSATDNIITLNTTDLEGTTHGFGDVEVGDYVEIVDLDEPANYVLFVVTKAPEGSGIVNVEVSLKDKGQNILVGETCEIRFFQVNEQDLQLDDLDARYLKKTGGNLTGGINMGTNPIMSVQYLGMTGAKCIQEAQTTRIKFDGKVTIAKAGTNKDGFVLKGATADGSDKDLLSVYHNDTGLDAVNYKGKQDSSTNIATVGYVDNAVGNGAQSGSPMSAKLMVGFQVWSEGRLSEGCFNMLDENKQVTSKVKGVRFLTFHIIQSWDHVEWFWHALRGKGQIHLTDKDGKWLMSKFVIGAEKREAGSGDNPVDALWFFELEEYGFDVDVTLSGNYFMEFDSCLEQA
jgi:hypothetical protein